MGSRDLDLGEVNEPPRSPAMEFSHEQRQIIRDTFANGASDAEFAVLMEVARARRLNPLLRQIHFVQRWDSEKHRMVWSTQVSIDGLRAVAERTGLYQGQDEPEFVENPDGTLKVCKVRVWRRDWPRPAVGVAYWNEYVQTIRDKQTGKLRPAALWARMPHVMLAKCAEAVALRKAFPEDMAGLYASEEMSQAQSDAPTPRIDTPTRVVAVREGPRTELHIHASLPARAATREQSPDTEIIPVVALVSPERPPPTRPGSEASTVALVKSDPWLDYYG